MRFIIFAILILWPITAHAEWIGVAMGWERPNFSGRTSIIITIRQIYQDAVDASLRSCNSKGRYDCQQMGAYTGKCFSIATGDPKYSGRGEFEALNEYQVASGQTLKEADDWALDKCRSIKFQSCRIVKSRLRKCR